jgi:hypothetical protein
MQCVLHSAAVNTGKRVQSTHNRVLRYHTAIASASTSNIGILHKILRTTVNTPWYVPNKQVHTDLGICPVREEITNISQKYEDKLAAQANELATTLLIDEVEPRRLKRFKSADLMK